MDVHVFDSEEGMSHRGMSDDGDAEPSEGELNHVNNSLVHDEDDISEPFLGMEFDSEGAAKTYYDEYCRLMGFSSKVGQLSRSKTDGTIVAREFVCGRDGVKRSADSCDAMLRIELKSDKWVVTKFVKEHKHSAMSPNKVHYLRPRRHLAGAEKSMVDGYQGVGIVPSGVMYVSMDGNRVSTDTNNCGVRSTPLAEANRSVELYNCINLTETIEEFELSWSSLLEKYNLSAHDWLQSLYSARAQWVPVYFRDSFFAAISPNQGFDGSFFYGYVNQQTTIPLFFRQYERAMENWFEREIEADFDTICTTPVLRTPSPMEKQAADLYTRKIFTKFQEELVETFVYTANRIEGNETISTFRVAKFEDVNKAYIVTLNYPEIRANCSCQMFEYLGILCRHVLTVFTVTNVLTLPPHYILKRWTRNAKSGVGTDEHGGELHGQVSPTARYNSLCWEAIKYAEDGAIATETYNVAMGAFKEAGKKVSVVKKSVAKVVPPGSRAISAAYDDNRSSTSAPDTAPLLWPQQDEITRRFNLNDTGGPAQSVSDLNMPHMAPVSLHRDDNHPDNLPVLPCLKSMTWVMENKNSTPGNRVAVINLKLQDYGKNPSAEMEVKFQLSRVTLEPMLRSMAYISEQLSTPANRVAVINLKLQDTETTTGESEVKFQVSRDTLGAMLRSMAYIQEQLSNITEPQSEPLSKRSLLASSSIPKPPHLPTTMVAAKKTKKTHESINNRLALVMKSGKYTLGYKTVLKSLRNSKGKLIIIANNCPPLRKSEIEYYAMLCKVGVHHYNGNNVDLGTACGKYFRVCCLSIIEPGDSDIIKRNQSDNGGAKPEAPHAHSNVSDEQSKLGTKYSVPQIAFFKAIVEAIAQDVTAGGCICNMDALNIRLENQVLNNSGSQSQDGSLGIPAAFRNFTMSQKEKTIDQLVTDKWLCYTEDDNIGVGVRSILDLRSWFHNAGVPSCEVCNEAGLKAKSCPNGGCTVRIHQYCLKTKFSQKGVVVCPSCDTQWQYQPPKAEPLELEEEETEAMQSQPSSQPSQSQIQSSLRSKRKRERVGRNDDADTVGCDTRRVTRLYVDEGTLLYFGGN
ncbi:hypothetical protein V6N11_026189 [Hibiscus sabdariffa]|uniref:Non-structural maintenance of chromosomes element 1 homolog n=1 Tax=Hibiscus sabdariffa TaxID=183260 RepID=A0ABR2SUY1_9ROSI